MRTSNFGPCMCGAPDCPSCGVAQGTYYDNICEACNRWSEEGLLDFCGLHVCRKCARFKGLSDDEIDNEITR